MTDSWEKREGSRKEKGVRRERKRRREREGKERGRGRGIGETGRRGGGR